MRFPVPLETQSNRGMQAVKDFITPLMAQSEKPREQFLSVVVAEAITK